MKAIVLPAPLGVAAEDEPAPPVAAGLDAGAAEDGAAEDGAAEDGAAEDGAAAELLPADDVELLEPAAGLLDEEQADKARAPAVRATAT